MARALHLDYYRLKRRCTAGAGDASQPTPPPAFVEVRLEPSPSERTTRWRIELHDRSAAHLTIEMGTEIPALVAFVEAFGKRRSCCR